MKKKEILITILAGVIAFSAGACASYKLQDKVPVEDNKPVIEEKVEKPLEDEEDKKPVVDEEKPVEKPAEKPNKEPDKKPEEKPAEKPNKKPEQKPVVDENEVIDFQGKVLLFDIKDPNSEKITLSKQDIQMHFESTRKKELINRVNKMYDIMYENSTMYPAASITEAKLNNGVLTIKFSPDFLENFNGGSMMEDVIFRTLTYNFMELKGVKGVMYEFAPSEYAHGLHQDYSIPMTNKVTENYFKFE